MLYAENVPVGTNKCPIHKTWIKSLRAHRAGPQERNRYCPVCLTEKHKSEGYSPKSVPTNIRKITI